MIKNKINISIFFNVLFAIFSLLGSVVFLSKGINRIFYKKFEMSDIWMLLLFVSLILGMLIFLNSIKILFIQSQSLRYHSLFRPFGKTLSFKDYIGTYQTTETGSSGSYKVIYLVDKNNITRFKIMGLYYKNMEEIIEAIPLPQIKRNLSGKEYFKLMFTGRANLSKIKDKKNTNTKTLGFLKIFIAISSLVFIVGMVVKIISKIN